MLSMFSFDRWLACSNGTHCSLSPTTSAVLSVSKLFLPKSTIDMHLIELHGWRTIHLTYKSKRMRYFNSFWLFAQKNSEC